MFDQSRVEQIRLQYPMQRQKSKQKLRPKQRPSENHHLTDDSDLYYIASQQDLLKKFTLSFYNMETRKSNKHIVMEKVGNIGTIHIQSQTPLKPVENKGKKERKSIKYSPDLKGRTNQEFFKVMTSETQSSLQAQAIKTIKKQMRSVSPVMLKGGKMTHMKRKSKEQGSKPSK